MYCHYCRTLVLTSEICPQCNRRLAIFETPPTDFDKKGDLYHHCQMLEEGSLGIPNFLEFLQRERGKVATARAKLVGGEAEPWLEQAFEYWLKALELAQGWQDTRSPQLLSEALSWATRTDEAIKRSVLENHEKNVAAARAQQLAMRLSGQVEPPPLPPQEEIHFHPPPRF